MSDDSVSPVPAAHGSGAGLRDPVSPAFDARTGPLLGLACLLLAAGVAALLWQANPAFGTGAAGGIPSQLAPTPAPVGGTALSGAAAEGKLLVGQKGCGGCHVIPGLATAKGTIGPNLTGVGSRDKIAGGAVPVTGPDDLKRWVMDPPGVKPGTTMPNLNLTDDEATKIAAFLATLR